MKFLYADELKRIFEVTGHFYTLELSGQFFDCRNILEIKRIRKRKSISEHPDCVVVMMNPGSSIPLVDDFVPSVYSFDSISELKFASELVPTRPDNAQYQIMRLMQKKRWNFVRILNLSDLRNGNSSNFRTDFKEVCSFINGGVNSIVHPARREELLSMIRCNDAPRILAAWGSLDVLKDNAIEFISATEELCGLPLEHPWYRYPSPYRKDQKLQWLADVSVVVS